MDWGFVWIPFILLKTENNKNNKKKFTVHSFFTVHIHLCTVYVPWTIHQALVFKKKKKKERNTDTDADANADVGSAKHASQTHYKCIIIW